MLYSWEIKSKLDLNEFKFYSGKVRNYTPNAQKLVYSNRENYSNLHSQFIPNLLVFMHFRSKIWCFYTHKTLKIFKLTNEIGYV